MEGGSLQPFRGFIVPGLFFDSGYAIWLARFTATPAGIGPYSQTWLVAPGGRRALFVDPESAGPTVALFHDPDEGFAASTEWYLPRPEVLVLTLRASDETSLKLELALGSTAATWMTNALLRAPGTMHPDGRPGASVERGLRAVFGPSGLRLVGRTEMGRAYRLVPERVVAVRAASGELDGVDLGQLAPPPRPIRFGDLQLTDKPGLVSGTWYLEYTVWQGDLRVAI